MTERGERRSWRSSASRFRAETEDAAGSASRAGISAVSDLLAEAPRIASRAASSPGAASAERISGKSRDGSVRGSRDSSARATTPSSDAEAKNQAAPRPSWKNTRARPAGRRSAYGLAPPPVSDIAQKRSDRSTTIASGARKSPSARASPSRVKRNRERREPPIASERALAPPSPSAT